MRARRDVATSITGQAEVERGARLRRGVLAALAVFVLVALATQALWFGDPVTDFDEQIYSLIGWMREKLAILMVIRHADGKPAKALATPINIYPTIVNRSFHGAMPMRPDRSFVFNTYDTLYRFTDVTDVLK